MPSWQELRRESGAVTAVQRRHGSTHPCRRHPSSQCTGDTGAAGLREDASLGGSTLRGTGRAAFAAARPRTGGLGVHGVHRLSSSIDPGLSYLNEPWPRASARKTFHLTSAIRAVTQWQERSSATVINVLTPLRAAVGLHGCLWCRMG